jgi:redox-sensitive bicupin YhaK (pirin superfamily)
MDPRYRDVPAATIPEVALAEGVRVKVIAGEVGGVTGPVTDVVVAPEYLDITLDPGASIERPTPSGHTVFMYAADGAGCVGEDDRELTDGQVALLGDGESILASARETGFRFLLVSGRPIGEPVAWHGPIVMNTQQELMTAFRQYEEGTFIKPPTSD